MDILHMCIRKENGHYWFYKMDEEKIPLQYVINVKNMVRYCPNSLSGFYSLYLISFEESVPRIVFGKETNTCIDSATGPLWRATYINSDETLKEKKTFTTNILFTFHHAISDGYTLINICNNFFKAFNDVIGEKFKNFTFWRINDGHETEEL
ncbi:hypothetical protein Avbf_15193 [Armadillidium vulgare]|nr:hypothetical protein Avbf_15193 [Armadillidium vulgare]